MFQYGATRKYQNLVEKLNLMYKNWAWYLGKKWNYRDFLDSTSIYVTFSCTIQKSQILHSLQTLLQKLQSHFLNPTAFARDQKRLCSLSVKYVLFMNKSLKYKRAFLKSIKGRFLAEPGQIWRPLLFRWPLFRKDSREVTWLYLEMHSRRVTKSQKFPFRVSKSHLR